MNIPTRKPGNVLAFLTNNFTRSISTIAVYLLDQLCIVPSFRIIWTGSIYL